MSADIEAGPVERGLQNGRLHRQLEIGGPRRLAQRQRTKCRARNQTSPICLHATHVSNAPRFHTITADLPARRHNDCAAGSGSWMAVAKAPPGHKAGIAEGPQSFPQSPNAGTFIASNSQLQEARRSQPNRWQPFAKVVQQRCCTRRDPKRVTRPGGRLGGSVRHGVDEAPVSDAAPLIQSISQKLQTRTLPMYWPNTL